MDFINEIFAALESAVKKLYEIIANVFKLFEQPETEDEQ